MSETTVERSILAAVMSGNGCELSVSDNRAAWDSGEESPLSAFRAMSAAAVNVYETIKNDGTQKASVDLMQTRMELYDVLGYQAYEDKLDALFQEQGLKTGEE